MSLIQYVWYYTYNKETYKSWKNNNNNNNKLRSRSHYFVNNFLKTAIFENDVSDHFPIYFLFPSNETPNLKQTTNIYYRNVDKFKISLSIVDWGKVNFAKHQATFKQNFHT